MEHSEHDRADGAKRKYVQIVDRLAGVIGRLRQRAEQLEAEERRRLAEEQLEMGKIAKIIGEVSILGVHNSYSA